MIRYRFTATLLEDDKRTGYKKGWTERPKGFYYNKNSIILVGDIFSNHTTRLLFPIDSIKIEIKEIVT